MSHINPTSTIKSLSSSGLEKLVLRLAICTQSDIDGLRKNIIKNKLLCALSDANIISEANAIEKISTNLNIPISSFNDLQPTKREYLVKFNEAMGKDYVFERCCLPIFIDDKNITIACADPLDHEMLSTIEFTFGLRVKLTIAKEKDIWAALSKSEGIQLLNEASAGMLSAIKSESIDAKSDLASETITSIQAGSESAPVIRLVNKILLDAFEQKASDAHFEPSVNSLEVRFRVDGVLNYYVTVPKNIQSYVITRIKLLASMDITEKRRPQDGRFRIQLPNSLQVDFRASTVPTPYGEKIVLRVLNSQSVQSGLEYLGLSENMLSQLKQVLEYRDRMIVVTGPTGSGKSTTLYSALHYLKKDSTNIITVEDPIEYRIEGITQIQVDDKIGMTFASSLRSILRQDPDIIMVGEIRDAETAEIGFQAAQTGHLVLATLHTNTAASAVVRLLDLGIEPFLIASSLGAVVSQRLVRKLCPLCASVPSTEEKDKYAAEHKIDPEKILKAVGCSACEDTGYKGRQGIYSLLVVNQEIRELIRVAAAEDRIEQAARELGAKSLWESGLQLVENGITSLEELERVIGAAPITSNKNECESTTSLSTSNAALKESETDTMQALKYLFMAGTEEALNASAINMQSSDEYKSDAPSIVDLARIYVKGGEVLSSSPSVLVVDDEDGIRAVMTRALRKAGCKTDEAIDGVDALEKLNSEMPDVILCDLVMPRMGGEDFIKQLRSDTRTKNIPILVLTGSDDERNEIKLLEAGANDFISKTSSPTLVIARLKRLCNV